MNPSLTAGRRTARASRRGKNGTLRTLNLAYNSFASLPASELGLALSRNHALESVDLSYNSVDPPAAMVLANAFKSNLNLTSLNLDGNQVAQRAMRR